MDQEIYLTNAGISSLSIIGCLFILIVYYKYTNLQVHAFKLVRTLAILDLISSITWMLPYDNEVTCEIQAMSQTFFPLSGILWTGVIANTLFMTVVLQWQLNESFYQFYSLIAVLILSAIATVLPYSTSGVNGNPYGNTGGWCWIEVTSDTRYGSFWRMVVFYIPLFLVFVFNITASILVIKTINAELNSVAESSMIEKKLVRRLLMYPAILFVCYIPASVLRMYNFFLPDDENEGMIMAAGISACLNGFLDALAYGLTESVRENLKKCCKKKNSFISQASSTIIEFDDDF